MRKSVLITTVDHENLRDDLNLTDELNKFYQYAERHENFVGWVGGPVDTAYGILVTFDFLDDVESYCAKQRAKEHGRDIRHAAVAAWKEQQRG